jgi:twitching motility protein PilU
MHIEPYLKLMAQKNASDLFFTVGAPASVKIEGEMRPISRQPMAPGSVREMAYELMDERKIDEFERTREMNIGISVEELGRFRVNIYVQRGEVSMVIRYIKSDVPTIEQLQLPNVLKDLVLNKNGLVLVVGSTGSGKSTSLAAMLDYRNATVTATSSPWRTPSSTPSAIASPSSGSAKWDSIPSPTRAPCARPCARPPT